MADTTYCTIDDVKNRLSQISGSTITDATISGSIIQAEGTIDATMRLIGRGTNKDYTFDYEKHGLVRDVTIALTSYALIPYLVEDFLSTSSAALTADLIWANINRNMGILLDDRVRKWYQEV